MWKRSKRPLIVLLSLLAILPCCSSCGLLYYLNESEEHRQMRMLGYELCHIESCGPAALANAFKHLNIDKDYVQIGKEIQDADNIHYREVSSLVSHEFSRITCPPELIKYCKSQGLTVKKVSFSSLSSGDVAIVLIRGKDRITDWHWISWPENSKEEIVNYFEENTRILSTYRLSK